MTFEDSIDLFTYRSDLKLTRKELTYCYGMCKMSVPLENELGQSAKYQKLQLSEFYELIARVAKLKFHGSELEDRPLHDKIEFVIDEMVGVIPNLTRKEV